MSRDSLTGPVERDSRRLSRPGVGKEISPIWVHDHNAMGLLEIITGEMLLVPGVEAHDSGRDDFELRVGGKAFAHVHRPDRIDVRLPPDIKENILGRGIASRSPQPHDREGWVALKLGQNPDLKALTRLLHQSYRFTSTML